MTTFTLISCSLKPNSSTCIHHFFWSFLLAASTSLGLKICGRCCIQVPEFFHFCSCCAPRRLTEVNEHKLLGKQELANKQTNKHFLTTAKELNNGICYTAFFGKSAISVLVLLKTSQLPIYSTNHLILCFSSKLWGMPVSRKPLDHMASPCRSGNNVKSKYILQQVLFSSAILQIPLFLQRANTNSKYCIILCKTCSFFARHLNKYFDISWTTEILRALPWYWMRSYLPKTWKQVISSSTFGNTFCIYSVFLQKPTLWIIWQLKSHTWWVLSTLLVAPLVGWSHNTTGSKAQLTSLICSS